jgi:hypothetical protein
LKSIEGEDAAKKLLGVCELVFTKKPGDEITEIKGSADRIGYVISRADNAKEAVSICDSAIELVKIHVE